jgi:uncharacterized protein (DUF934 family)
VLLPLACGWRARTKIHRREHGTVGVWLDSQRRAGSARRRPRRFAVIGVNFPKFADGRGYSTARLLRERYGYTAKSAPSATCCTTSSSS